MERSTARRYRGIFATLSGADPVPDFRSSERDLTDALALQPGQVWFLVNRGRTRTRLGWFLEQQGKDGRSELAAARADFDEALRLYPSTPAVWPWRAELDASLAMASAATGDWAAAESLFATAERDFASGIGGDPTHWPYLARGQFRLRWARALRLSRRDPSDVLAQAEQDQREAKKRHDQYADVFVLRAEIEIERAAVFKRLGKDARRFVATATAAADEALALNPKHAQGWVVRGRIERTRGRMARAQAAWDRASAVNRWIHAPSADSYD